MQPYLFHVLVQVLLQDKLLKMAKSEKLPPFPVSTNDD
jgi:hypothetical protein